MNRKIRRSVFETNSSSTHSFTYVNNSGYNNLVVDDYDNCVHVDFNKFGWEVKTYCDSRTKLDYILLVAAHFTGHDFWCNSENIKEEIESFKETEEFQRIEDSVKITMNCDGIYIEDYADGYIDHQSLEYSSFREWLYDTGADSVDEFIFGDIILCTDNDNY